MSFGRRDFLNCDKRETTWLPELNCCEKKVKECFVVTDLNLQFAFFLPRPLWHPFQQNRIRPKRVTHQDEIHCGNKCGTQWWYLSYQWNQCKLWIQVSHSRRNRTQCRFVDPIEWCSGAQVSKTIKWNWCIDVVAKEFSANSFVVNSGLLLSASELEKCSCRREICGRIHCVSALLFIQG